MSSLHLPRDYDERLLIDMDGVITDTMGSAINRINAQYGTDIIHHDIHDYWFNDLTLPPEVFMDALRTKGFYRSLDVITGAVGAVNRLREQYDVVVCSQPMPGAENCETEKREWLAEHFDDEFAEEALIVKDKGLVPAKAIIEDNPHIDVPYSVVMFDQAWNRTSPAPRMYGWHDLRIVGKVMK